MTRPRPSQAPTALRPLTDAETLALMDHALALGDRAARLGEVPVGALIVNHEGDIVAEAHNAPIGTHDPSGHAEILALRKAAAATGNYRLTGHRLIVTLEPCAMCAGAISHARIGELIYGASDPKGGAVAHGPKLFEADTIHHRPTLIQSGVRAEKASQQLKQFFAARRGR